jgi:UDP-N-acetylglucosamine 4,6-dehydratase/5-epimerase
MRITELASAVDSRARLKIVGIRPGEKLHESLMTSEEAPFTEDCGSYFVVRPQKEPQRNGVRNGNVPADFEYRSDKNDRWLLSDELQQFIQDPR